MFRPLLPLVGLLMAHTAMAQDLTVTTDNCGELWASYFNRGLNAQPAQTGNALFNAVDKLASIGKKKKREVIVASCSAGAPRTSTVTVWAGERYYDNNGNPIVQAYCTDVDVTEIQGKKRDTCRRFSTSRICQHVNDATKIEVAVGSSSVVTCPTE